MNTIYTIGSFCFRLICPDNLNIPENFQKFQSNDTPEYTYEILVRETLPELTGKVIAQRIDLTVTQTETGECRRIGVKGREDDYAQYCETAADHAVIYLAEDVLSETHFDTIFVSLFALERRMIEREGLILHCAYMENKEEAILFSAPSETGKTTQANQWKKYRGSETVNGDRSLLLFHDGNLYANGWPVCGSSEICFNKSVKVKAIVMLSQAKENTVKRLSPRDAFMQVYSQITINQWNRNSVNHAMNLIEQIVTTVPIYHLACTISEEAVDVLEQAIYQQA